MHISKKWFYCPFQYWITGGATPQGVTDSTEVYEPISGTFGPGPQLPIGPRASHCMAMINNTHLFLAGGETQDDVMSDAYIVDVSQEDFVWSQVSVSSITAHT